MVVTIVVAVVVAVVAAGLGFLAGRAGRDRGGPGPAMPAAEPFPEHDPSAGESFAVLGPASRLGPVAAPAPPEGAASAAPAAQETSGAMEEPPAAHEPPAQPAAEPPPAPTAAPPAVAAEASAGMDALVAALWELELDRVERLWRLSTVPLDGPDRPEGGGARLRSALSMELERHREEAGGDTSLEGHVDATAVTDIQALAALRLTQEALGEYGRRAERIDVTLGAAGADVEVRLWALGARPGDAAGRLVSAASGMGARAEVDPADGGVAVLISVPPVAGEAQPSSV